MRGQTFRLQKDLVAWLVGKAVHLVLDAGAVARAHAFDHTGEHRAAVKPGTDDLVRARIGVGDPARHLPRVLTGLPEKTEHRHRVQVARLLGQTGKVDRAPIDARRRTRLQPPLWQLQRLQPGRQGDGWRVSRAAGAVVLQADVDAPVQKGAGCQNHRLAAKPNASLRHRACHPVAMPVALHRQVVHRLLEQPQVRLVLQPPADGCLVEDAVCLGAGGTHRRPLAAVEDAELDAGLVGGCGHGSTQCIHLLDQMSFADAADAGVAAHLAQGLDVVGQQQGRAPHAGSCQGSLGAGMAAADDDDIE